MKNDSVRAEARFESQTKGDPGECKACIAIINRNRKVDSKCAKFNFTIFKTTIMLTQIKTFKGNALAFELKEPFTEEDAQLIKQLFEDKVNEGFKHINLLIQVKDLSVLKHMELKAFFKSEIWGFRHFGKIGRCAVVAHSDLIKSAVKIESKVLHLANAALEEKYFDTSQLEEALKFISPEE